MKRSRRLLLLLALVAWASTSPAASLRIDESALAEMRSARPTFDEVVRRYGRPNFGSKLWDSRTAAYAYGEGWSPNALTAMGAALGGTGADTVVLYFDERDVLIDYKINHGARPGETPGTYRYVEPSLGGTKPAAKPAAAPAVTPVQATAILPESATKPAAAQQSKPEPRNDGLPWWLPSSSTRGDARY